MAKTGAYNITIIVNHVIEGELVKVIKDACKSAKCYLTIYYKQGLNITCIRNILEKEGFKIVFVKEFKQNEKVSFGDMAIVLSHISNAGELYDRFKLKDLKIPVIFILK